MIRTFFAAVVFAFSVLLGPSTAGFWAPYMAASNVQTLYPGQSGYPVGYAATPASAPASFAAANGQTWSGAYSSLTAWPGGTGTHNFRGSVATSSSLPASANTTGDNFIALDTSHLWNWSGSSWVDSGAISFTGAGTSGNPYVLAFFDVDTLTGGAGFTVSASNVIFVGFRFQSNATSGLGSNVNPTGSNLTFIYCSFIPRTAVAPTIPNAAWPSAGAGQQILPDTGSYSSYTIPNANGYQFSIYGRNASGALTVDHSDAWGFAQFSNLPDGSTFQFTFTNNWIHDARNDNSGADHTDGPGYLNGPSLANPSNITISGNTIASIGNTNAIAMQGGTGSMNNLVIDSNFLSGFGYNTFLRVGSSATGCHFTNNVIGTDLAMQFGFSHDDNSTIYTTANGNLWRNNVLKVLAGTSYIGGGNQPWTSANNGQFLLPNSTLSATDWSS